MPTFGTDGVITIAYRYGFVCPALAARLSRLSKMISISGVLDLDYEHQGPPEVMAWLEPGRMDEIMRARVGPAEYGLPPFFEIQYPRELVDPGALDELNCLVFPQVCSVLVPTRPSSAPVGVGG